MIGLFLSYFITNFVAFNLISLFYNLLIFISIQFFPTPPSSRRVLSVLPQNEGNSIPGSAGLRMFLFLYNLPFL